MGINPKIGITGLPRSGKSAVLKKVIDMLVDSGVKAILNFVPIRPKIPKTVHLLNIDLSIELEKLTYFLRNE